MKDKKAQLQVPGAAVSVYSYILFTLMIIIFLFLFSIRSCTDAETESENIISNARNLDYPVLMLNYLRIEKNNMTLAQRIPLHLERDAGKTGFPEQLKEETQEFLKNIEKKVKQEFYEYDIECVGIAIDNEFNGLSASGRQCSRHKTITSTYIPYHDELLKVSIIFGEQDEDFIY